MSSKIVNMDFGTDLQLITAGELATDRERVAYTIAWLENRDLSDRTREAYLADVTAFLGWCSIGGLDPLAARFTHINAYRRYLETTINGHTGRPASRASTGRRISAISSWYRSLVNLGVVPVNPAVGSDRPKVDKDHSSTVAFTAAHAKAMTEVAALDDSFGGALGTLIARLLVDLGPRVSELCAIQLVDLGYDSGHRTLKLRMKGGKTRTRPLPPTSIAALDAYLAERAALERCAVAEVAGLLLVTEDGYSPNRFDILRFVGRLARAAGIPDAKKITPHSFRHAWNTVATDAKAALEDRQHAMGHADPRTTQRYDRKRGSLERDPSYLVSLAVG